MISTALAFPASVNTSIGGRYQVYGMGNVVGLVIYKVMDDGSMQGAGPSSTREVLERKR